MNCSSLLFVDLILLNICFPLILLFNTQGFNKFDLISYSYNSTRNAFKDLVLNSRLKFDLRAKPLLQNSK